MHDKGCPRCFANQTVITDDSVVCTNCGLVLSEGSYDLDDENYLVWSQYLRAIGDDFNGVRAPGYFSKNDIGVSRKIDWEAYTGNYFREAIAIYCDADHLYKGLPADIMEDIAENLSLPEYTYLKDQFIQDPSQKNTQTLLRHVKASKHISYEYRSKYTGEYLVYYRRKNFVMKWVSLREYLIDYFDIKDPPSNYKLTFEVFDVISRIHDYSTSRFHRFMNSKNINDRRVALPNAKVFLVSCLVLISPELFEDYEYLIELPLINTTAKNVVLMNEMINFTYLRGYADLRGLVCNAVEEFYNHGCWYDIVEYLYFVDENDNFSTHVEKDYKESFKCLLERYPLEPPTSTAIVIRNIYSQMCC